MFYPQLIRNVWSRRRIDSSSIIARSVNFDMQIVKLLCQELDIYMTLLIIDMNFLYQFNLRLIASLFTVSFHEMFEKKLAFKIFKIWQVCDWLAKWIIMLGFMNLRWPRVFRRSNVGLVIWWQSEIIWFVSNIKTLAIYPCPAKDGFLQMCVKSIIATNVAVPTLSDNAPTVAMLVYMKHNIFSLTIYIYIYCTK